MASFLKEFLPTCLGHTGNIALIAIFTEADTAKTELTHITVRSATDLAAIITAYLEFRLAFPLFNQ